MTKKNSNFKLADWRKVFLYSFLFLFFIAISIILFMILLSKNLPSIDELKSFNPEQISKIISSDNEIIHKGRLTSLKRFKDDTTEVLENYECGIGVDGFADFNENAIIEVYEIKEVKRTLS